MPKYDTSDTTNDDYFSYNHSSGTSPSWDPEKEYFRPDTGIPKKGESKMNFEPEKWQRVNEKAALNNNVKVVSMIDEQGEDREILEVNSSLKISFLNKSDEYLKELLILACRENDFLTVSAISEFLKYAYGTEQRRVLSKRS